MGYSNFIIKKSKYGDYRLMLYNQEYLDKANRTSKTKRSDTFMYYYTIDDELKYNDMSQGDKDLIDSAFNRSKRNILDIALNNGFTHFMTITFNMKKINRENKRLCKKKFLQSMQNYQKKYNVKLEYLAVAENHYNNTAIHFHILIKGLDESLSSNDYHLIYKKGQFKRINDLTGKKEFAEYDEYGSDYFYKRFGWNFILPISKYEKFIAFYLVKYVNKDTSRIFYQRYFCSKGLKRSLTISKGFMNPDYNVSLVPTISNSSYEVYEFKDQKTLDDFQKMSLIKED